MLYIYDIYKIWSVIDSPHIIPVFSEPEEKTLDPVYSIALSSDSVPIVSVKQTKVGSQGQR